MPQACLPLPSTLQLVLHSALQSLCSCSTPALAVYPSIISQTAVEAHPGVSALPSLIDCPGPSEFSF